MATKTLVVGASGFLGRSIVQAFMDFGFEVWGTYSKNKEHVPVGCHPINMRELLSVKEDFSHVVIAAGNHSLSEKELIDVNVGVTKNIISLFPNSHIIYISSVSVYGSHTDIMTENSPSNNPSSYGKSKLLGEAEVLKHPLSTVLRLTYLYGKDMPANSFLPAIINKAKTTKKIDLYGNGERLQDYLHVTDAANLCLLVAKQTKIGTYLGATGRSLSNKQVAQIIIRSIPDCRLNFSGEDTADWFRFDSSYTQRVLNWQPIIKFEDSVKDWIAS